MAAIGIVCEGSHDFCFLEEVVDELLTQRGFVGNQFTALQPRIDATSTQLDGGGYEAVRQWLIVNKQIGMRKFFAPTLFSTSKVYDAVIVQLDGDVADLSVDFKASGYGAGIVSVADRVNSVSSWLKSLSQIEPAFAGSLLAAIPTLQMEAWIIAALRPGAKHVEDRNRKRATKRFLGAKYSGTAIDKVKAAGIDARVQLAAMQARAISFNMFCAEINGRF